MAIPKTLEAVAFYDTLEAELRAQTDRSLGILAFSFVDSLISALFEDWFVEDADKKRLFGANGPLSTASAKIAMAHAAGLISSDERRDLDLLRKIRNGLAHGYAPVSFEADPLRSLCQELTLGKRLFVPKDIPLYEAPDGKRYVVTDFDAVANLPVVPVELPNADQPRERFVATVSALTRVLAARWMRASSTRVTPPEEFEYGEDPYELMITDVERLDAQLADLEARVRAAEDALGPLGDEAGAQSSDGDGAARSQLALWIALTRYGNEVLRRSRGAAGGR